MSKKITCDIYNKMKPLLTSPMDDELVGVQFGFSAQTVRGVRRSENFAEYQAWHKTRRMSREAALNRITEICETATYDRQNLKYATNKKVVGRVIGDGELKFRDKNTIEMYYGKNNNCKTVFMRHRGRGVYANNWRPFRKALAEAKPMDVGRVWKLANKFDIDHITRSTKQNN